MYGHRLMGQVGDEANARWLSFRNVSNQCWHVGNIVLAGDSAHTTHFSAGEGTRLAIDDAIALAENVQRYANLEKALVVSTNGSAAQKYGTLRTSLVSAPSGSRTFPVISR